MPWNSTAPIGSISVKANRTILQDNTTYIETTMGNSIVGTNTTSTRDHFWDVSSDVDGRHRFIQSVGFTVGGNPEDPLLGTGMDSVLYPKTTNTRVEWFHRNTDGIYQFIPSFLSGTILIPGTSYVTLVNVPANVYGEILLFTTIEGNRSAVSGYFKSNSTVCDSWALFQRREGSSTGDIPIKFANGVDASLLTIRVANETAASGQTWNYRIIYRAI